MVPAQCYAQLHHAASWHELINILHRIGQENGAGPSVQLSYDQCVILFMGIKLMFKVYILATCKQIHVTYLFNKFASLWKPKLLSMLASAHLRTHTHLLHGTHLPVPLRFFSILSSRVPLRLLSGFLPRIPINFT
jgi:hypothetical protein